jgi:hypothetical protein
MSKRVCLVHALQGLQEQIQVQSQELQQAGEQLQEASHKLEAMRECKACPCLAVLLRTLPLPGAVTQGCGQMEQLRWRTATVIQLCLKRAELQDRLCKHVPRLFCAHLASTAVWR